jgi:hypothetical protein
LGGSRPALRISCSFCLRSLLSNKPMFFLTDASSSYEMSGWPARIHKLGSAGVDIFP